MTRSNYGGANPHYPHSHDSGSGYTRGGGLFSCWLMLVGLIGAVGCFVFVAARILDFAASTLAGAL